MCSFFVFHTNQMDFVPGNDCSEWQILGDEDRSVLYQQVTVHEPMGWSGLSLECYKEACARFSGMTHIHYEFVISRSYCVKVEFRRDITYEL